MEIQSRRVIYPEPLVVNAPDLLNYLPQVVNDIADFKEMTKAQNNRLIELQNQLALMINNSYIQSMDSFSLSMVEYSLGIEPKPDDTLDVRRNRVLNRLAIGTNLTNIYLRQRLALMKEHYNPIDSDPIYGAFLLDYIDYTRTSDPLVSYAIGARMIYDDKNKEEFSSIMRIVNEFLVSTIPSNIQIKSSVHFYLQMFAKETIKATTGEFSWNYRVGVNAQTAEGVAILENYKSNYKLSDSEISHSSKPFLEIDEFEEKEVVKNMSSLTENGKRILYKALFDQIVAVRINKSLTISEIRKDISSYAISYKLPHEVTHITSLEFLGAEGVALTDVPCDAPILGFTNMVHHFLPENTKQQQTDTVNNQ